MTDSPPPPRPVFARDLLTRSVLNEKAAANFRAESRKVILRDAEAEAYVICYRHPDGRILLDAVCHAESDPPRPPSVAFARAQCNDVTVHSMLRHECTLEEIIGALAEEKERCVQRIMELESIAPRKVVTPDGKVMLWQCPPELIPVARTTSQ